MVRKECVPVMCIFYLAADLMLCLVHIQPYMHCILCILQLTMMYTVYISIYTHVYRIYLTHTYTTPYSV